MLLRAVYAADGVVAARWALAHFYRWCDGVGVAELSRLVRTVRAWEPEVLAFHATSGCSNRPTEALILLIKKVKRVGHGFRNFANYRLLLLLHCGATWQTHQTARALPVLGGVRAAPAGMDQRGSTSSHIDGGYDRVRTSGREHSCRTGWRWSDRRRYGTRPRFEVAGAEDQGGSMSEAVVAASAAICIAVLGALLSYASTRRLHRAKARLDRLNAQLQEFYGPLYAIFQAEHIAHLKFVDTLRPGSSTLFAPDVPPLNDDELALWRLWAQSTHQHRSSRAYEVIIGKAHLLIEDEMPPSLLTFCAHKAGYDVLIKRWKQQDYSEHLSVVRHPGDELRDYLRESFTRLKR